MARSREDIVKDRLEETRLEIDRQQTIIDNDRKSAKEKEAAKKRQLVLIERELAIQERLASIEERRIRQQERANIAQEKAAEIQKKAAEKQEQLYESFKDTLHDQLLSLKKKAKAERTISEDGQKQLNLAYKYQHLLKQAVTEKDGEIQINETLLKQLKKEYKEKNRALQDSIELNEIEIKLKQKQLDSSILDYNKKISELDSGIISIKDKKILINKTYDEKIKNINHINVHGIDSFFTGRYW